ncbi:hypothetical protein Tco_0577390, partial [Tanacetum coccineum]
LPRPAREAVALIQLMPFLYILYWLEQPLQPQPAVVQLLVLLPLVRTSLSDCGSFLVL